jgi:hypothetical protein
VALADTIFESFIGKSKGTHDFQNIILSMTYLGPRSAPSISGFSQPDPPFLADKFQSQHHAV